MAPHTTDYGRSAHISDEQVLAIASICHEANRQYCKTIDDDSQPSWDEAPDWQRKSAVSGVEAIISGRVTYPEQSHENWMSEKEADGWTWGSVKDPKKKEHPSFQPFSTLSYKEQRKDYLFFAIVSAFLK